MSSLGRALEQAGVRCVFGIPGTQSVSLFESMRQSRLRTVLTASELGAAFMAGAFARTSGDVGVLITIAGPGFMYALPGIGEAQADSAALVHITGLPARESGRQFQFQAIDQAAIAGSLVKAVMSVSDGHQLADAVSEAMAIARAGEPGPVLLQIADSPSESAPREAAPLPSSVYRERFVNEAARAFIEARRPLLLIGQGVAGSEALLIRLAEVRRAPVLTTPSGRGLIPEDHELSCGFDPLRHDLDEVNALIDECDLVLALGCKLGHNGSAGFALKLPPDRLIHVDPSPAVPGANYPTRLSVYATAERFLATVLSHPLTASEWNEVDLAEWRGKVRAPQDPELPEPDVGAEGKAPSDFFATLRRDLPRDAVMVTDSGMHQVLARRYYDVLAAHGMLFPSDFQSMGFGVPAAIGAAIAAPGRRVVAVVGDGGLRMTGMELTTAVRERLPLVLFVFSDGKLNQIRLQQFAEYGRAHAVDLAPLDLQGFASAAGAAYQRFEGDVAAVLARAAQHPGPTLVEVRVSDSSAVRRVRVGAVVREGVRQALGPHVVSWLKRWR